MEDGIGSIRIWWTMQEEWIMTGTTSQPRAPQGPDSMTAGDVMRPALTTVEPNAHLAAAAYLMRHAHATLWSSWTATTPIDRSV